MILQVDLTNAFEDGRACLETLEIKRRNGRISEVEEASIMAKLKERFREEYRKVEGARWSIVSVGEGLSFAMRCQTSVFSCSSSLGTVLGVTLIAREGMGMVDENGSASSV